MLKLLFKALFSMLVNRHRMPGRGWATECMARVGALIFAKGAILPIESFRQVLDKVDLSHPAVKHVSFSWVEKAGISCMLTMPNEHTRPDLQIVYLHGGGYITGSPKAYRVLLAQLASATGAQITTPDYRLSPEHPFPVPQDDCLAVVKQVRAEHPDAKLVVMGDSAGGGLSIHAALNFDKIDAIMLISPWVEPTADSGTIISNERNDIFIHEFLETSFKSHIQSGDRFDQRVNFKNAELSRLPKTYIQVAGGELFHDQVVEFSERAKQQKVALTLDVYATQFHVFQVLGPHLKDSKHATSKIAAFLQSV
jgi:monoterpene epsilon-lactone hydrolase